MKKLNLLLIVAILATTLLAANPAGKLVRLEVINASGDTVYIKLEGKHTDAFYYLTIADGDTTTFTVLVDDYKRTTWACNGIMSTGGLVMSGNIRLKFVQCGSFPIKLNWADWDNDGVIDPPQLCVSPIPSGACWELNYRPNFGEPTQEKVVYWSAYGISRWAKVCRNFDISYFPSRCIWNNSPFFPPDLTWNFVIWWKYTVGIAWRTVRFPFGVYMRYTY